MKNITQIVSPLTILTIYCSLLFELIIFFHPSLRELLVFFAVDLVMAGVGFVANNFFFSRFFPWTGSFFPTLQLSNLMTNASKHDVFNAMVRYPKLISLFIIPSNFIKVVPASLVALLYWNHGLPLTMAALYLFVMVFFNFSYMSGMAYLENHSFLSREIAQLHRNHDWSDVFQPGRNRYMVRDLSSGFFTVVHLSIFAIWVFASALLLTSVNSPHLSHGMRGLSCISTALFACFFTMRIAAYSRKEVLQGLESLFEFYDPRKNQVQKYLPLHTSPDVRSFQQAFNSLVLQINESEREAANWIIERAEHNRFTNLGEMAGLVVHDLVNPIHNIQYCANALKEHSIYGKNTYVEQIDESSSYAVSLLNNLKNNIRKPNTTPTLSSLQAAAQSTAKMIKYYFLPGETNAVSFSHKIPSSADTVLMPQPELNQVLINLVSNSYKNLIANRIENPKVSIALTRETATHLHFTVEDNGTGISANEFEFFNDQVKKDSPIGRRSTGLGLRLTKRLVEQYGGHLGMVPSQKAGTIFRLELKKGSVDHTV